MHKDEKRSKRQLQLNKWKVITGVVVIIAALLLIIPYMQELDEEDIDGILLTAFKDRQNIPHHACIDILKGEKLPGYIETKSLVFDNSTTVRSDVEALINNGLITVNFNAGKVATLRDKIAAIYAGKAVPDAMLVPASYVNLTPKGKAFYRYDDVRDASPPRDKFPRGVVGANLFCAQIEYGGVEKFTTPNKNPFDNNPHQVTWVGFRWKVNERATPWSTDPELAEWLSVPVGKDGWAHDGILLERDDDGNWGLGEKPYTIRW
ncbi:hypothetical protein A8N28_002772 [Salmonella enterica]|nr:hypothetical protein [Salmonella enterica]EKT7776763.1 hypothetical protein [Salmonella enterica]